MRSPAAALAALAAGLALLAGCASRPAPADAAAAASTTPPPMPSAEPAAAESPPLPPAARGEADAALAAFEQRHRQAADTAAQQGRWAAAVWAWDVVLALRPGDAKAAARRAQALEAATAAVAERRPRAHQARQRGDLDGAVRLYLEILALSPHDANAADALRAIERQRTRRGNVAGYRAPTGATAMRRSGNGNGGLAHADAALGGDAGLPSSSPATADREVRNDLEHASLLAAQGELDGAIALLRPRATGPRADPAARAALADLHVRQADGLLARGERTGAVAALQRSLQLVPGHPDARSRLSALQGSVPAPAATSTSPPPAPPSR